MNGRRPRKADARREKVISRILLVAAAVVLFSGLVLQISLRVQINAQSKELERVNSEIELLKANAQNLDLCIENLYNDDKITERAHQLGMSEPREDQLRRITLYQPNGNTTAQTVANVSGEEING